MSSKKGDTPNDSSSKGNSKRPNYSKFTQQELPAFKPILTPLLTVLLFTALGITFIPIGIISLNASSDVVEITYRYDQDCIPSSPDDKALHVAYIQNSNTNKSCITTLNVVKKMTGPVYIYYQLENFYQNHRRYVKSRSDNQLKSASYKNDTKSCAPEDNIGDSPIVPCGMIAWSLFNDTYEFSIDGKSLPITKKGIAWESDINHKFGADVYPEHFQSRDRIGGAKLDEHKPLREQEDLIVWMRPAALPNFRKLYGKIESDLVLGQKISVVIQNNYNTYSFGGKKSLVLSTTSWIGGKNIALGVSYLAVGGFCFLVASIFVVMFFLKPRTLGDPAYLSWNRKSGGTSDKYLGN